MYGQEGRGVLIPPCKPLFADQEFCDRTGWDGHYARDAEWKNDSLVSSCIDEAKSAILEKTQGGLTGRAIYMMHFDAEGKVDFVCYQNQLHPYITYKMNGCLRLPEFSNPDSTGRGMPGWLPYPIYFNWNWDVEN